MVVVWIVKRFRLGRGGRVEVRVLVEAFAMEEHCMEADAGDKAEFHLRPHPLLAGLGMAWPNTLAHGSRSAILLSS